MLIVNLVDSGSEDAANNIINMAKEKDIPVIFFNRAVSTAEDGGESVISSYDKCAFVGTDYARGRPHAGPDDRRVPVGQLRQPWISTATAYISYVMFKGQEGNAEAERPHPVRRGGRQQAADRRRQARARVTTTLRNTNKYLVDQDGTWSAQAANDYMATILSQYSEANGNMVELVICQQRRHGSGRHLRSAERRLQQGEGATDHPRIRRGRHRLLPRQLID